MPHDPEAFADMVVMHTKAALAPVLADVKSLQTQVAGWESRWNDLGALRERVAVVESKAATEPRLEPVVQSEDHLSPVLERLAVAEQCNKELAARVHELSGLRDRVVVVETKSAAVVPVEAVTAPAVNLSPVLERVAAAEARLDVLGDLRDRVITVETKAAVPVPPDAAFYELRDRVLAMAAESKAMPAVEIPADVLVRITALEARPVALAEKVADLTPVLERLTKAEMRMELKATETAPILTTLADLTKDVGVMRERIAVVETRALVSGPAGTDGKNGADGQNGTLEHIKVMRRSERSFEFCFKDGTPVEGGLIKMNYPIFDDDFAYIKGKHYEMNTLAQWGGSIWVALIDGPSGVPGQGSPEQTGWKLLVKRGSDGKNGRDAEGALPVVAVGRAG